MHTRHHLAGRKVRPRFKLPHLAPPENARLYMASADIDGEYSPVVFWLHIRENNTSIRTCTQRTRNHCSRGARYGRGWVYSAISHDASSRRPGSHETIRIGDF